MVRTNESPKITRLVASLIDKFLGCLISAFFAVYGFAFFLKLDPLMFAPGKSNVFLSDLWVLGYMLIFVLGCFGLGFFIVRIYEILSYQQAGVIKGTLL